MFLKLIDRIEKLLKAILPEWLENDISIIVSAIAIVFVLIYYGRIAIQNIFTWSKTQYLSKDLHPFYTRREVKEALDFFIQTNFQNIDPSLGANPNINTSFTSVNPLINHFVEIAFDKYNENKYFIVLGGSGMGKSTFLINLLFAYRNSWKKFFRLRHYYNIQLFPLGHDGTELAINNIPIDEQRNTILLLDALDEDSQAIEDYKKRLDEIMELTQFFRMIVVSARTQFFKSDEELPNETGFFKAAGKKGKYNFGKIYITPFSMKDVDKYLIKRFRFPFLKTRKKARDIVKMVPNLMIRPMLLSYIKDLVDENKTYTTTLGVYDTLIKKWIERENDSKPQKPEHFKEQLFSLTKNLAPVIYDTSKKKKRFYLTNDEMQNFKSDFSINLDELQMRSRSLLNRTANGGLKYSHKSIFEYFLAYDYFESNLTKNYNFRGLDFGVSILRELCTNWLKDNYRPYLELTNSDSLSHFFRLSQINFTQEYYSLSKNLRERIILGLPIYPLDEIEKSIQYHKSKMMLRDKEYQSLKIKLKSNKESLLINNPGEKLEELSTIHKEYKRLIKNLEVIKKFNNKLENEYGVQQYI